MYTWNVSVDNAHVNLHDIANTNALYGDGIVIVLIYGYLTYFTCQDGYFLNT